MEKLLLFTGERLRVSQIFVKRNAVLHLNDKTGTDQNQHDSKQKLGKTLQHDSTLLLFFLNISLTNYYIVFDAKRQEKVWIV